MEILPGAFEREWERRRAVLLHEMQIGQIDKKDWDEPRKGGVARLPDEGIGGFGRARRGVGGGQGGSARGGTGAAGRSMRTRFAALARGSQPAVVKLASYGGGARAAAMMSYTSRDGDLAVENERGERVLGKDALAEQRADWEHLFDNRVASRDLGVFHVTIDGASLREDVDRGEQVREVLGAGFRHRRYVYAVQERESGELQVSGVLVLRDPGGERLTGDRKAAEIIEQRYGDSNVGQNVEARFRFHGHGNGVEWGTARVRDLVARTDEVRDESGRLIDGAEQAGDLMQKEWRKELHSRKGRDVMHVIVSARAGTDASAFQAAVREFLGKQFSGHRYVFAVHDPALDPKEMSEGGKRPHIHAHAIVTMRSETGERIETSPRTFREWRSSMAEKAREQGIDMELTDRRELACAPAYTRNQVRPVSFRGRTEHEGTSEAAHVRYQAKRSNEPGLAQTDRSRQYTAAAAEVWDHLASDHTDSRVTAFAASQKDRIEVAARNSQTDHVIASNETETMKNNVNMALFAELIDGKEDQMREMTRPEFDAYEKRVEAVLTSVEQTIDSSDRADFEEVVAAAREVVDIRREYLEFTERRFDREGGQSSYGSRDDRYEDPSAEWDAAVARFGLQAVETANEVLVEINHYREGLERIEAGELPQSFPANYRAGLERQINRAAEMAVDGDNQYMREVAKSDQELRRTIDQLELSRAEDRRNDGDRYPDTDPTGAATNNQNEGALGGIRRAEFEPHRVPTRDIQSMPEQDDHVAEQKPTIPSEQRTRHPDERAIEKEPVLDAELVRSDPPQQHMPRLRQIELDLEERQDRDRDDRER